MSDAEPAKENFPGGDVVPRESELRISVDKDAYAEIMAHAKEETEVEICGVLMGKVKQDKHGAWLHIQHTIRGENAKQQGANVTFTHEAWNHINKQWDKEYPNLGIVGWYHTHPGFDIFLSDMDKFIHNSFFANPHQVAYVYDPHQGTEGFFRKVKDEVLLLDRYWHGGKPRKIVPAEQRVKPSASSGGAVSGDALASLTNRVAQLELDVRDRGGVFLSNLLLLVIVIFAITYLGWQMLGPRAARLPIWVDPQTGVRYYVEMYPDPSNDRPPDSKVSKPPEAMPDKK